MDLKKIPNKLFFFDVNKPGSVIDEINEHINNGHELLGIEYLKEESRIQVFF